MDAPRLRRPSSPPKSPARKTPPIAIPQSTPPSQPSAASPIMTRAPASPSTAAGGVCYPRLELLLPADDPRLAELHAARDAYNAERDAYLRSTLAKDAEDYDPAGDPIAAYLGVDVWEEEDRALADPDFRRELSEALVRSGYKPLDETPIAEQRNDARNYLKQKREAEGPEEAPDLPEIPDELLDQVLADATACKAIETMLKKAGVREPLKDLPRETQRQAVAAFIAKLEELKGNEAAPSASPPKKKRWWWPFGR